MIQYFPNGQNDFLSNICNIIQGRKTIRILQLHVNFCDKNPDLIDHYYCVIDKGSPYYLGKEGSQYKNLYINSDYIIHHDTFETLDELFENLIVNVITWEDNFILQDIFQARDYLSSPAAYEP